MSTSLILLCLMLASADLANAKLKDLGPRAKATSKIRACGKRLARVVEVLCDGKYFVPEHKNPHIFTFTEFMSYSTIDLNSHCCNDRCELRYISKYCAEYDEDLMGEAAMAAPPEE